MSWAYRILFPLLLLLALPYYVWRMLRRGGYGTGFVQRLGFFPKIPPKTPGRSRVWIQAVSVGEIEAIGPLLRQLQASGKITDQAYMKRWLNDPDNRFFRTRPGQV